MIALSIRQPWAWLIVQGYKDIENRGWSSPFRGQILIHAARKFDHDGYEFASDFMRQNYGIEIPNPSRYDRGGLIGLSSVIDCVRQSTSPWFIGPYGFVLANSRAIVFQPCKGQLGFFEIDAAVAFAP